MVDCHTTLVYLRKSYNDIQDRAYNTNTSQNSRDWIMSDNHVVMLLLVPNLYMNHLTGTLTQPLAKAMAKITKGVAIPNMMM